MLNLSFKVSSGPSFELSIDPAATVLDVKKAAAASSGIPDSHQRLIYKGRILRDSETIQQHGIESGHTLHLVKGPGAAAAPSAPALVPVPAPAATIPAPAATPAAQVPAAQPNRPPTSMAFPGATGDMMGMGGGFGGGQGAFGMPTMDPAMMSSLMQTPMFQQMMQTMSSNPQLMAQMMQTNPMLQQAVASNPALGAMLQNPEMLRVLLNPQTMQAILSLQSAMNATASHATAAAAAPSATPAGQPNYAAMMQALAANPMLAQMMAGGGQDEEHSAPLPPQAVAELQSRYVNELAQMEAMGFIDKLANIEALRVCDGNVEQAINFLLSGGF